MCPLMHSCCDMQHAHQLHSAGRQKAVVNHCSFGKWLLLAAELFISGAHLRSVCCMVPAVLISGMLCMIYFQLSRLYNC